MGCMGRNLIGQWLMWVCLEIVLLTKYLLQRQSSRFKPVKQQLKSAIPRRECSVWTKHPVQFSSKTESPQCVYLLHNDAAFWESAALKSGGIKWNATSQIIRMDLRGCIKNAHLHRESVSQSAAPFCRSRTSRCTDESASLATSISSVMWPQGCSPNTPTATRGGCCGKRPVIWWWYLSTALP